MAVQVGDVAAAGVGGAADAAHAIPEEGGRRLVTEEAAVAGVHVGIRAGVGGAPALELGQVLLGGTEEGVQALLRARLRVTLAARVQDVVVH